MGTAEDRAAAAARRAERKRARVHAPPPDRDPAMAGLTLDQLRQARTSLAHEETQVSYWRRLVQARVDVLASGEGGPEAVNDLGRLLADAGGSHRRLAHLTVAAEDDLPALPDLARLWAADVEPGDADAAAALVEQLRHAERQLSDYRMDLHRRLDAITAELIARYREDPSLALSALPTDRPRG